MAHVDPKAQIGSNVTISPFCFIDADVIIDDDTWVGPNVSIFNGARIGKSCRIFPGAVIAGIPQDLKFNGEYSTAEIGDHTTIRECVTVNRGTQAAGKTKVGAHCLLMAYVHVAHDCLLGDHIILANGVNLAGHVEIEDHAILEGLVGVQQFLRIGKHSFIAGGSMVRKNVPPFLKAAREPLSYIGVNAIGLRRRGFDQEVIHHIQDVYRLLFVSGEKMSAAVDRVKAELPESEASTYILDFIRNSPKGVLKGVQTSDKKLNKTEKAEKAEKKPNRKDKDIDVQSRIHTS